MGREDGREPPWRRDPGVTIDVRLAEALLRAVNEGREVCGVIVAIDLE